MLSKTNRPAVSRSLTATIAVIAGFACSAAHAQTFTEPGDAGGLVPGTPTVGAGVLTRINGSLNSLSDSDLYAIHITDPAAFSASTVGLSTLDTQLYLFDSTGRGVVACDDVSVSVRQSTIGGQLVTDPGVYYLLITSFDTDPTFNGAQIWNDQPYVGQRAPDGPGAAGTINGYTSEVGFTGAYRIALTGAEFFSDTSLNCPPNMNAVQNSATGEGPLDIVTGDFDSDGKLDAITCNHISNNASVLMGNGDGTFQLPENLIAGAGPWGGRARRFQ